MAIDTAQLQTDIVNVIADLPTTFIFSGSSYTGVFTDFDAGNTLNPGGQINDFSAQLYVNRSAFSILPTYGNTIGIGGITYRIDNVSKSPDGVGIRLDLISPDK